MLNLGKNGPIALPRLARFSVDIFKHVIDAFAGTGATESSSNFIGRVMTGLLVAGGSGAIFNIFTKLGLRSPDKLAAKAAQARGQVAPAAQASTRPGPQAPNG